MQYYLKKSVPLFLSYMCKEEGREEKYRGITFHSLCSFSCFKEFIVLARLASVSLLMLFE